jgi:hypothetical protein
MELNVDNLISFFQEYSGDEKQEMGEQDAGAAPASGGAAPSGGGSNVPKWADLYSIKRGKANMLGKGGEKWNTGLNRGVANQIW